MIRRPPRSTQSRSSAASDVYKRQGNGREAQANNSNANNASPAKNNNANPNSKNAAKPNIAKKPPTGYKISDWQGNYQAKNISARSGENATAVSYTHLRAHETVLDLVCRLLLEKKKKTTKKKNTKHYLQ